MLTVKIPSSILILGGMLMGHVMNFNEVFVTGSTGLLGNNLVMELLNRGIKVKALARNTAKAVRQLGEHPNLKIVLGDMEDVDSFSSELKGCDVLFHTAAYFRDSYKGGKHWPKLFKINVQGTANLLEAAYGQGIRRVVHVSSIAVIQGIVDRAVDETSLRTEDDADDYYKSKILSDQEVFKALQRYKDLDASFILPGWMHGPGDSGPTSAGQFTIDYLLQKLPSIPPSTVSFVDARDVANVMISAAEKGRRGERYLAAGQHITMKELVRVYESVTDVKAPSKEVPFTILFILAAFNELYSAITGKEVLLSLAAVKNIKAEAGKTRFDHTKSFRELGANFRPIQQTISDEVEWLRANGKV